MWAEYVVCSRPCSEGFSPGTFLSPRKKKFQFSLEHTDTFERAHERFVCSVGKQITST